MDTLGANCCDTNDLETARTTDNGFQRLDDLDNPLLTRFVLASNEAIQPVARAPFATFVRVHGGQIIVLWKKHCSQDDQTDPLQQPFFSSITDGVDWTCTVVRRGEQLVLPAFTLYSITFSKEASLLATGYLVPKTQQLEPSKKGLCHICRAIPFTELADEDSAGYPHQPGLDELVASSCTCRLCSLLLDAILDTEKDFQNQRFLRDTYVKPGAVAEGSQNPSEGKFAFNYRASTIGSTAVVQIVLRSKRLHKFTERATGSADSYIPKLPGNFHSQDTAPIDGGSPRPWLYGNWWTLQGVKNCPPQLVGIGVRLSQQPQTAKAGRADSVTGVVYRGSDVRVLSLPFGPLGLTVPGKTIDSHSDKQIVFKKLAAFLNTCDKNHQCAAAVSVLPTRVLDLAGSRETGMIRLVDGNGDRGKYVALSHCWGSSQPMKTTASTLQQHKQGIRLASLPKTFRDAVTICTELGVSYLWIDSLCIIQGDADDWNREALNMSNVYSNTWLTIAASAAPSSDAGCFPVRPSSTYVPTDSRSTGFATERDYVTTEEVGRELDFHGLQFHKEWMPPSFRAHPRLYQIGSFGANIDPADDEPLNKRGWTLQERYLSPRVIHYASDQVYLECQFGTVAEDGSRFESLFSKQALVAYKRQPWPPASYAGTFAISDTGGNSSVRRESKSKQRFTFGWNTAVQEFSKRELSFEEDKLPAIAGLASWLAKETNDQYFAGVWKEYVFQDIMWRAYPCEEPSTKWDESASRQHDGRLKTLLPLKRPSKARAPGWSWASVDGSIVFEYILQTDLCATFCAATIDAVDGSAFGRVRSGTLRIMVRGLV
ncbi:hypothetical protein SBRCBS47491_006963 [Sporothrix bragantina]|uniref:Heterokaryon incompatibility domain-containing protein n=1 Tax=Sporothrix bragantina TaxID=671064 RepID=A0ABP0C9A6_9PEZI